MNARTFSPTDEQARIVGHDGSAFISACPGAGKTRVLVERARKLLVDRSSGQGIAFLSFTIAAVSELEDRLRRERLIGSPVFPHFIGTFDAFLWQFLIVPFGVPGCAERPRPIPDKEEKTIEPFRGAQALPLDCFDRMSGKAIPEELARRGFSRNIAPYETAARNVRAAFLKRGELDFADAREIALKRLRDPVTSGVLSRAFAARFQELIVDEAQDCNPADLEIISCFREAGIPVKVICDPHQAIYGFRGGVTSELGAFAETFPFCERLPMTGNFRSSHHIAKAVVALRAPSARVDIDKALGEYRDEPTPVHILSYPGNSAPDSIGIRFRDLTETLALDARECPVIAATRKLGAAALGHPGDSGVKDLSYRLAVAVSNYHFSFDLGNRKGALEDLHKIVVELEGHIADKTYHQHIVDSGLVPESWRPRMLELAEALSFDPARYATADAWLEHARTLLAPFLPTGNGQSINQRLRRNSDLSNALSKAPRVGHAARTIHSVKGMEFPAVCVVMSTKTTRGILDFLTSPDGTADNEDARKIYVGASRARRLLVIAVPRSQADRLMRLLRSTGAEVFLSAL